MDKNAIRKFATFARNELIQKVSQKALEYGISEEKTSFTDKKLYTDEPLSNSEKIQLQALIKKIQDQGYNEVIEEVAYTWFNRLIALRFMEVNGYLPSHIRVFTDEFDNLNPEILQEAINLQFENMDFEKVYELKEKSNDEELFKYLLILQCNDLNQYLPEMFQKINDYTELLLPDNLLRKDSVIDKMINEIPNEDWTEQVEIIGWLYQYYNEEKKDQVINIFKGNIKKEDIPSATQLFTTDWVVRYIVDNSLGKYWIERNPQSKLIEQLEYFISSKENKIKYIEDSITPEDIKVLDPCMGSAHFSVYAFEVLMKIYLEQGYNERSAAQLIVEKNLFGLDLDDRAGQLANFAIMMKALEYDKRFLTRKIQPNFYSIQESNTIHPHIIDEFSKEDQQLKNDLNILVQQFHNAKNYGSIIEINDVNFEKIYEKFDAIKNEVLLYHSEIKTKLKSIVNQAFVLSQKYDIVITNPPYLNKYNSDLKKYILKHYPDYKQDLFSIFIYRNLMLCKPNGYCGFMTPFVWMFISSYEKLRDYILENKSISSLIQMEYSAFEEATVPICAFVLKNGNLNFGCYIKLSNFKGGMEVQKQKVLEAIKSDSCDYFYETNQNNFEKIPGSPIAYWASDNVIKAFENGLILKQLGEIKSGIMANVQLFIRNWFEVDSLRISSSMNSVDMMYLYKWFFISSGGEKKKWYGNIEKIVDLEDNGKNIKISGTNYRLRDKKYYFKRGITWGRITSSKISFRIVDSNILFGDAGPILFLNNNIELILSFLNSKIASAFLDIINPTLNFQVNDLERIPVLVNQLNNKTILSLSKKCIDISKSDWDSFETSWDFEKHPFINDEKTIEKSFNIWNQITQKRFRELKSNEEELNRIFIDIYGLSDEMDEFVDDKDITLYRADVKNDVKSFISYAVGCMMGRYSLDKDGLVYAGGEFDSSNYVTFTADKDGIIPISDDEYFEDDIVHRFIEFVKVIYGEDNLEDNLKFIANALGEKTHSRAVIRNYFIKDFYKDHVKLYKKRPIYWLFDSGKKNGFKCLIYMHRYKKDTIARIRTDYIHEQQSRYRTALADLENRLNDSEGAEKIKLEKERASIQEKSRELLSYEEKIHSLADEMIEIDLDDGVKNNYDIFKDVLAKI